MNVGINAPSPYSGKIFNATGLEYSYFPGGYFDSNGNPHYMHADYQGSIIAVTDSARTVVQTTNYYPYGEPWREPTGQPMLFAGKERTTNSDYLFGPRNLMSAALLWTAPDQLAGQFRNLSPYSYCAGNPILFSDPTGRNLVISSGVSKIAEVFILSALMSLTDDVLKSTLQEDGSRLIEIEDQRRGVKTTGSMLISMVINNPHTVTIENNEFLDWSASAFDTENLYNGVGEDAIINFNKNDNFELLIPVSTPEGLIVPESADDISCLAHELIHSLDYISGTRTIGQGYDRYSGYPVSNEELEVIGQEGNRKITEQTIRKEQGLKPRGSYYLPK